MKGEIVLSVKGFVILVFVLKVVKIMGERDSLDRLSWFNMRLLFEFVGLRIERVYICLILWLVIVLL